MLTSATLQAPASVTASPNCPNAKSGSITVSWPASPSQFTTGYTISRAVNGGTAALLASVPASTTSYVDSKVTGKTTYVYTVAATYLSWTSAAVSAPLVKTPNRC